MNVDNVQFDVDEALHIRGQRMWENCSSTNDMGSTQAGAQVGPQGSGRSHLQGRGLHTSSTAPMTNMGLTH